MWSRFTEPLRRAVYHAQDEARSRGANSVTPDDLFLGVLREEGSIATSALVNVGMNLVALRAEIIAALPKREPYEGEKFQITPSFKRMVDLAYHAARASDDNYVGTEHFLFAVVREGQTLSARTLARLGLDPDAVVAEVARLQGTAKKAAEYRAATIRSVHEDFGFSSDHVSEDELRSAAQESWTAVWARATPRLDALSDRAEIDARGRGSADVGTEHLVLALLDDPICRGVRVLDSLDVDLGEVRRRAETLAAANCAGVAPDPIRLSVPAYTVLRTAHLASIAMGNPFLGTEHLALVLFGGAAGEFADPAALAPHLVREAVARSQAEE